MLLAMPVVASVPVMAAVPVVAAVPVMAWLGLRAVAEIVTRTAHVY